MLKLRGDMPVKFINLKSVFLPDSDDLELYDLDIANAEMRVLTAYSRDSAMIDAFNSGKDLHCLTAAGISEYSYEDIMLHKDDKTTDQYKKRQVAKKVNFGTIYCMSAKTLQAKLWSDMRIRVSLEEAQEYLDLFFKTYPGVRKYIDDTIAFIAQNFYCYTFTGRRRRFAIARYNSALANRVGRQGVNARIQTTSADLVNTNIIDLDKELKPVYGPTARMILTVHDSLLFQLPKGATGVKPMLDRIVTDGIAEKFKWMPVQWKYDCGKGPNYGDCHEAIAA